MKHLSHRVGIASTQVELANDPRHCAFLRVAATDVDCLIEAAIHYGESWYKRDGAGAFFMLARKWDRLENHLAKAGNYNILTAVRMDQRAEGIIDDIRDLRRYLLLVEAKLAELGQLPGEVAKGEVNIAVTGGTISGDDVRVLVKALDERRVTVEAGSRGKMARATELNKQYDALLTDFIEYLHLQKLHTGKDAQAIIKKVRLLRENQDVFPPCRPSTINMQNGVEQAEHITGPWTPLSPGEAPTMMYIRQECPDLPDDTPATDRD